MTLKEALDIRQKEVVCLVGGGGKTTLMFGLAGELAVNGSCVITTTTTKIMAPTLGQTEELITETEEEALLCKVAAAVDGRHHITVASEKHASGRLTGITPDVASSLSQVRGVSYLIIEADGAARRPLKAPRSYEPVIPPNTTLVIAVVGIDALGRRLEEGNVFRSATAAELLQTPLGTPVSPEMIARLITCPGGIPKGAPTAATIVPFINKTDLEDGLQKGRRVAQAILAEKHPQIPYVILGQARCADPVVEMY